MNRTRSAALVALFALSGFALPAFSQDAGSALEKLKQLRENARQAALSAAAKNPRPTTPTVTTPPPPPTPRPTPPPPPTNPPPTATPTVVPVASASASAKKLDAPKVAAPAPTTVDKLRSTRPERRHAEVERLEQRWGDLLSDERAKAELTLHAQRVAYLQRIRSLAEKGNDPKLLESVDQLITQEDRRDADAMNALRSGAPGGAK